MSDYGAFSFMVTQLMNRRNHATLVKVLKVSQAGTVAAVGTVEVMPMVNLMDGRRNKIDNAPIYNVPYFRLQGGANAVILDPIAGDIGICIFSDKDISAVKASKAPANPGSYRRGDLADGLYMGGFLNGTPTNYVQFVGNDINVKAAGNVNITAPAISLKNAGTLLKKLVNETFLTLFDAHTHLYSPGGGTPAQTGAPASPSVPGNKTSVTQAE
jgi:hypothetical protein